MDRTQKQGIVDALRERLGKSQVAILCDFRGLKVEEVNRVRSELYKESVGYQVVKNTLAALAMEGTPMLDALRPYLAGPTAIAYTHEDPTAPAKVLTRLVKDLPNLTIKGGYLDGRALSAKDVESLASMPGKAELRAKLLGLFAAPASSFVRVLAGVPSQFVRLLEARRKQLAGEA